MQWGLPNENIGRLESFDLEAKSCVAKIQNGVFAAKTKRSIRP